MRAMKMNKTISKMLVLAPMLVLLLTATAHGAAPGIQGTTFNLTAQDAYITQPDGQSVYSWGYGCSATFTPVVAPAAITTGFCNTMQVPGPTLIVTEGQKITVTLTNNLPPSA